MTTQVRGQGILQHRFHGDYMAAIGIRFADVDSATDAARTLGASWKQSENRPNIIVAALSSSELAGSRRATPSASQLCRAAGASAAVSVTRSTASSIQSTTGRISISSCP
jgi:hypothetical protein